MAQESIQEVQARLRNLITEHQEDGWEEAWKSKTIPWDRTGEIQPPLKSLLESNELQWPRVGQALVPGCGRGYDPIFIATTLGLKSFGLDISKTGVEAAQQLLAGLTNTPQGLVEFKEADFFKLAQDDFGKFDLIYDHTFFVAIPPLKRSDWARQMDVLSRPGAFLIALVYPIQPYNTHGPPFYLRTEHYTNVLLEKWEKVIDRVPESSSPSHAGKQHLLVWRKR